MADTAAEAVALSASILAARGRASVRCPTPDFFICLVP